MGRAYLARSGSGRLVVVKVVHPHLADEPSFRARLRREVRAARAVSGPYTAAVLDADPAATPPWLAVEYCAGPTLSDALPAAGPLGSADLASLGAALAEALSAIHAAGLVHRDVKPANVVVTRTGPRVIDFGLAKAVAGGGGSAARSAEDRVTGSGEFMGSPGFMAPEQIAGTAEPAAPSDVFALGALLALAATGRPAHGAGSVAQIVYRTLHEEPDLAGLPDDAWAEFLGRCLAKAPADRPPLAEVLEWCAARAGEQPWWERAEVSALVDEDEQALARKVAAASQAEETGATRVGLPTARTHPPSRRRIMAWAGAAAMIAAAGTTGAIALNSGSKSGSKSGRKPPGPTWRSGTPQWTREVGALEYGGALTAASGAVYVRVDGVARRLDARTGAVAWEFEGADTLEVRDGTGYATVSASGLPPHEVVALDLRTGRQRWRTEHLRANPKRRAAFGSLDGGSALLAVTGRTACLVTCAAYDTRWARRTNRGQRWRAYGFDVRDGGALWFTEGTAAQVTAVHAAGGRFALATAAQAPGPLVVLRERTGAIEVEIRDGSATPEVHPGATGSRFYADGTSVRRVDSASGRTSWRQALADATVSPLAGGQSVAVATAEGLGALHSATGQRRWWREGLRPLTATDGRPVTDGSTLYATGPSPGTEGTGSWGIHALAVSTGSLLWAVPVDGLGGTSFGAGSGGLVHVCTEKTLQTFRAPEGAA
ncbi:PQQ-binding-like beta-propeller repeat protein [Streptomyces sp. TRM66268-LWL]|uniref:PQQ-binding-like beta-propeller repeat protein n=2 Tax=Streptomyces polyasparticus TaxID=2767826 RepID=A0ABR7SNR8_9ACTN|nr:PQQ-binding-like beta-propeller repeat protein [Streptomyces polyasparticus]